MDRLSRGPGNGGSIRAACLASSSARMPSFVDSGDDVVDGGAVGLHVTDGGLPGGLLEETGDPHLRAVKDVLVASLLGADQLRALQPRRDRLAGVEEETAAVGDLAAETVEVAVEGEAALVDHDDAPGELLEVV